MLDDNLLVMMTDDACIDLALICGEVVVECGFLMVALVGVKCEQYQIPNI